jgi:acyl carrier protein
MRVYKTGDLVKWTDEGELDFIGRLDNQVKIRGYRIELGDIEAKILEHSDVKTAAVVVNTLNNSDSQLIGYIVLKDNVTCSTESIKNFLSKKLPDYMIPSHLMIIEKMPLNTSGKIDRKSLPKPELIFDKEIIEPKSKIEKELIKIWSKLLNLDAIGVTNNFFDIGGNSLIAIRMVSELSESLKINIEPLILMQYPNIRELANYLSGSGEEDSEQDNLNIRTRRRDFSKLKNRSN